MSQELYYVAPSDTIFDDIKQAATRIWQTYDDTYGYQSEKINSIKDLTNVADNYMYMVAMFDDPNQQKLLAAVSPETADRILEAMS